MQIICLGDSITDCNHLFEDFLWEMGMYRYSQKCSVIRLLLSPYPQIPSDAHQALYS